MDPVFSSLTFLDGSSLLMAIRIASSNKLTASIISTSLFGVNRDNVRCLFVLSGRSLWRERHEATRRPNVYEAIRRDKKCVNQGHNRHLP